MTLLVVIRLCAVALVVGLLVSGCTGADRPTVDPSPARSAGPAVSGGPAGSGGPVVSAGPTSPAAGVAVVQCRHAIANQPPSAGLEVVLGVVALPTRALLQAYPSGDPGWLFAKQGIVVRADAAVDLSVPGEAGRHTRISWGNPGPEVSRVRFPGCPTDTGWLVYAGGYRVDAAACVPLTVRYAGSERQVRISVGARCPPG